MSCLGAAAKLVADSRYPSCQTRTPRLGIWTPCPGVPSPATTLMRVRPEGRSSTNELRHAAVFPDQRGVLRQPRRAARASSRADSRPAGQDRNPRALEREYAHHPTAWLHTDALSSARLAAIGRIAPTFKPLRTSLAGLARGEPLRASVAAWLEALDRSPASSVAMRWEPRWPRSRQPRCFLNTDRSTIDFGNIVLTAAEATGGGPDQESCLS